MSRAWTGHLQLASAPASLEAIGPKRPALGQRGASHVGGGA